MNSFFLVIFDGINSGVVTAPFYKSLLLALKTPGFIKDPHLQNTESVRTLELTESRRRNGRLWKEKRCEGKIESWGERWEMRGTERETGRYAVTKWKGGACTREQNVKCRTAEAGWLLTSQLHTVYVSMNTGMFCAWECVGALTLSMISGAWEGLSLKSESAWRQTVRTKALWNRMV